MHPQKWLIL